MRTLIRMFVKSLDEREFSKTTRQKFWDVCELAYCALAKQAIYGDEAEAMEERYRRYETEWLFRGFQESNMPDLSTDSLY